jgi:hypothetical protein
MVCYGEILEYLYSFIRAINLSSIVVSKSPALSRISIDINYSKDNMDYCKNQADVAYGILTICLFISPGIGNHLGDPHLLACSTLDEKLATPFSIII